MEIFNKCFREEKFLSAWKIGIVKILYKGDEKDPQNPKVVNIIIVASVVGKVYGKIINGIILGHLKKEYMLHSKLH